MIDWIIVGLCSLLCVSSSIVSPWPKFNKMVPKLLNGKVFAAIIAACQIIIFGIFIIVVVINDSSQHVSWKYEKSDKNIKGVVDDISQKFADSNATLKSIDYTPYDTANNEMPTKFYALVKKITAAVNELENQNYTKLAATIGTEESDFTKKIETISNGKCSNMADLKAKSGELGNKIRSIETKIDQVSDNYAKFRTSMIQALEDKRPTTVASISDEKAKVQKHVTAIKDFYELVLVELANHTNNITVERIKWDNELKAKYDNDRNHYHNLLIVASLIALIVIVLTVANLFLDHAHFRKLQFSILYLALVATFVFIILKLCIVDQSAEDCKDTPLALFKISVPSHMSVPNPVPCTIKNETFLSIGNNGTFILESAALQDYVKVLDKDIANFKKKHVFDQKTADQNELAIDDLKKSWNSSCFKDEHKEYIEKYMNLLEQMKRNIKPFHAHMNIVFDAMSEKAHILIETALQPVELQTTIDAVNNGIKKANFDCSTVIDAFTNGQKVKCDKEAVKPVAANGIDFYLTCIILMLASVILLSFVGLLAKERKIVEKKKEDKEVEDVKVAKPATIPTPVPITPVVAPKKEVEKKKKEYDKVLTEWAAEITKKSFDEMMAEYQKVADADAKAWKDRTLPAHKAWKRIKKYDEQLFRHGMPVYDHNRVVLKNFEPDFVSASWVTMPDSNKKYILAEGPLPNTIPRFWAMCYQENVKYIVMLCSMVEDRLEKCAQYVPRKLNEMKTYGDFEVTYVESKDQPYEATFWRMMKVVNTKKEGSEPLLVNHIYAGWWRDKDVPEDSNPVLYLHSWLKTIHTDDSPIVVHSSFGVGRTGTFVFIEYAIIQLQKKVDIIEALKEFRLMRNTAVQQPHQFVYAIICLLEYFIKNRMIDPEPLREYLADYKIWRKMQKYGRGI